MIPHKKPVGSVCVQTEKHQPNFGPQKLVLGYCAVSINFYLKLSDITKFQQQQRLPSWGVFLLVRRNQRQVLAQTRVSSSTRQMGLI